ncbi:hypothetical protein Nepgr_033412 [Nepenthes gracilis]|uniref:Uncharacterized protein n=1 Tax=Nepenthes gracilis TaxID=150966 RepID=A0AAD3TMB5_NEPGR|nr:hypothetical protein Nepgr_033412 [Nepenthes gracilis]
MDGKSVAEMDGCRTAWPVAKLDGEPVVELDGCREDWLVAELNGCRTDYGVVLSRNASLLLQLNYNSQSVQAAMWQLASMDLIESYNKVEVEYYCVTKDLRSNSSPVKSKFIQGLNEVDPQGYPGPRHRGFWHSKSIFKAVVMFGNVCCFSLLASWRPFCIYLVLVKMGLLNFVKKEKMEFLC